jgi:hypothetical protein
VGRPRKPDALTGAQRQESYQTKKGLVTIWVTTKVRRLLNKACKLAGIGQTELLEQLLREDLVDRRTRIAKMPAHNVTGGALQSDSRATPLRRKRGGDSIPATEDLFASRPTPTKKRTP